jgi:hypothetical protein
LTIVETLCERSFKLRRARRACTRRRHHIEEDRMLYDRVIRDGMIIDGTRSPRYRADIAIKDGVIARIGHIPPGQAHEEIDARGLADSVRLDALTLVDNTVLASATCRVPAVLGHVIGFSYYDFALTALADAGP